jgi:hypothetical protein
MKKRSGGLFFGVPFVLQVAGHDAGVVSPIPTSRCRSASELQPQPDSMRRRVSMELAKQRDRFASVSQQALVRRPPPEAARRRRVERVEETALGLPAHERQRCAPERQVSRCPAGRPVEQALHQCKPRRRIGPCCRDPRVSPGERVTVFAHRRLEVGTSGGIVASSASIELVSRIGFRGPPGGIFVMNTDLASATADADELLSISGQPTPVG